jgi:hypothetical protein
MRVRLPGSISATVGGNAEGTPVLVNRIPGADCRPWLRDYNSYLSASTLYVVAGHGNQSQTRAEEQAWPMGVMNHPH